MKSKKKKVRESGRYTEEKKTKHLLVEDLVVLVDVGDVAVVFVGTFPGELAFLVDTKLDDNGE